MKLPIMILVGQAGAGKDTVAGFVAKNFGGVTIAQADPMKRFARELFGFTEDQLWGPSPRREERATRYLFTSDVILIAARWIAEVLPSTPGDASLGALLDWYDRLPAHPTARQVLQTLGTEWGRAQSRQMWVEYAMRTARELLRGGFAYDRARGLVARADEAPDLVVITDGRFRNEVLSVREAGGFVIKIETPGAGLAGAAAQHSSEKEQQGLPAHFFDYVLVNNKTHGLPALEAEANAMAWGLLGAPTRRSTGGAVFTVSAADLSRGF